jgi:hypothetical protein
MSIVIIELEGSKLPYFKELGFETLKINVQDILTKMDGGYFI